MDMSLGVGRGSTEFLTTKDVGAVKVSEECAMVAVDDWAMVEWEIDAFANRGN